MLAKLDPGIKNLVGKSFAEELLRADFKKPSQKKELMKNLLAHLKISKQRKSEDECLSESDDLNLSATSSEVGNISKFLDAIYSDEALQKEIQNYPQTNMP